MKRKSDSAGKTVLREADRRHPKPPLHKDRSGSMFVFLLIILAFLLSFSAIVGEFYRIHSIQTHVEYEIGRAVNIAVEEAMQDSWRQDKQGKLDAAKASQNVHDYLQNRLGLTIALEKHSGGILVYHLQIDALAATEDPPGLRVEGKIFIPSAYPFLVAKVEIPFRISSRNRRLD